MSQTFDQLIPPGIRQQIPDAALPGHVTPGI